MTKSPAPRPSAEAPDPVKALVREAASIAVDRKAEELSVLDLEGVSYLADYFLLCSGANTRQVQAIADAVQHRLRDHKTRPRHVEGYRGGRWVLLDYADFVVHVFLKEQREFYGLDRLWGDAAEVTEEMLPPEAQSDSEGSSASAP